MSTNQPAAPAAPEASIQEAPVNNTQDSIESQELSGDQSQSDPVSELKDQIENGTPKEQAVAKKMLKKLKIKYNGQELEEELPFEIPDDEKSIKYMREKLQMDKMARAKASEYNQLEKEVAAFVEELRKNPKKALANPLVGVDIKKLAKEIIEEEIENSQKSPEQLEKEKLQRELQEIKEEREREKKEAEERELSAMEERNRIKYETDMADALKKEGLPNTPYFTKRIADQMKEFLKDGIRVTPEDVIPFIKQEMDDDLKAMFAAMPDEVIESVVGKDVIGRLRKKSIAKAKAAPPVPMKSAVKDVGTAPEKKPGEKVTFRKFFGGI